MDFFFFFYICDHFFGNTPKLSLDDVDFPLSGRIFEIFFEISKTFFFFLLLNENEITVEYATVLVST